jgi:autotransporter-associated beta strand protein
MVDPKVRPPHAVNRVGSVARHACAVLLATTALGVVSAHAVSGTWVGGNTGDPNEWVEPNNWSSAAVPNVTATFTSTGVTTVANDNGIVLIGQIQFVSGAQAYTVNIDNPFVVTAQGIINNSANPQTFNISSGNTLVFQNGSMASGGTGLVTFNNQSGGFINFQNTSTASSATIVNNSILQFSDTSTAGTANVTNNVEMDFFESTSAGNAVISNAATGTLTINNTATAGAATITNNGTVQFNNSGTAGSAHITNNNGGLTQFNNSSMAGTAVITTNSGGGVFFVGTSSGGQATFVTNVGGVFDMSGLTSAGTTAGSIAGAGNYFLGSKTLTVGGNNVSTDVSGVISDGGLSGGVGGALTKTGTGSLTLSGINTYTGATTVNGGMLIVDGSTVLSSLTTVNAGGTLGGSGTVGNTAIAGGTLAPGSTGGSIFGPLTVQGNLSFTAASTYMIQVSPANAGRTNVMGVTGSATLGGATVNAVFLPGSFVDRQYTIVNATGGVSGTFNPAVVSNVANLQSTLSYDANDAFLNIALVFVPPPSGTLNINQQNVANALTGFFNATGHIPAALAGLNAAGLTIASGELGTGVIQSSIKADDLFLNLLLDPSVAGRAVGFAPGGVASPFAAEDAEQAYAAKRRASPAERDAYAMVAKAPPMAAQPLDRWSVWGAAYGGSETVGGNAVVGSHDTTASVYGVVAGADYKVTPDSLLGFALAGGGTSFSLANGLGSGSSDLFQAGAFARQNFGPAYVSAALAYGWHDVTTNRSVAPVGSDQLQGRFQANTFSGRFEGGYRFATPLAGITPYAAAEVLSFDLPAYAEQTLAGSGVFALNYAAQTTTDTRTELGLRSDKSFAMVDAVLTLRGRAAWAHDYNPDRAVTAIFQALPGASFVVNGARPDPDSALVSAGAEMKWLNGFSLAATFEGEFSGNTTSYSGKGVARYTW